MPWPTTRSSPEGARYPGPRSFATTLGLSPLPESSETNPRKTAFPSAPEPIYAQDPSDAWNRIFYFLSSRQAADLVIQQKTMGAEFEALRECFESAGQASPR